MRLAEIILIGFKSFADKTVVRFPSNINAIVGPNGCGKSNIIDAIRWVLGESSAKYMRGASMADVIFNGTTEKRPPLAQASVELIFDEIGDRLTGQWAKYETLSIKRVVNREGVSNYYLNGTKCRRKDVIDVFLGTGLGNRSYAIILQDTVSRIIEAKPEELRNFIEEAAGISKYKERRHETELRVKNTKENLSRINDIIQEVDQRLQYLQKQAKAAEKYHQLKELEQTLKQQCLSLQWHLHQADLQKLNEDLVIATEKYSGLQSQIKEYENNYDQSSAEQKQLQTLLQNLQEKLFNHRTESERLLERKNFIIEKRQQLEIMIATNQNKRQALLLEINHATEALNQTKNAIQQFEPEQQQRQAYLIDIKDQLNKKQNQYESWQQKWDEFNQNSHQYVQRKQAVQLQLTHAEQQIEFITQKMQAINGEIANFDFKTIQHEITAIGEQLNELQAKHQQIQTEEANKQNQYQNQKQFFEQLNQHYEQLRQELHQVKQKEATLIGLQKAALEREDITVQQWLQQQQIPTSSRLAKLINVEKGWEIAAEAVLHDYLQAFCNDDNNLLNSAIVTPVNANFVLATKQTVAANSGTLASKLQCNYALPINLNQIYVAETLEKAQQLLKTLSEDQSVVTRNGLWLGKNWLKVFSSQEESPGIIVRESQLREIKQLIEHIELQLQKQNTNIQQSRQKVLTLESELQILHDQEKNLAIKISELNLNHKIKTNLLQSQEKNKQRLEHNLAQYTGEIDELTLNCQKYIEELEHFSSPESLEEHKQELILEKEQIKNELNKLQQQYQQSQLAVHEHELTLERLIQEQRSKQNDIDTTQKQINQIEQELAQASEKFLELKQHDLEKLELSLQENRQHENNLQNEITAQRNLLAEKEQQQAEVTAKLQQTQEELEKLRDRLENFRLQQKQKQVQSETLIQQLQLTEAEILTVIQSIPADKQFEQLEAELIQNQRRIQQLGAINLAALEEHQETATRKEYLDKQQADLLQALKTLEDAILKIDHESEQRFSETFEKVNGNFGDLFPKIFGGGHAQLTLIKDKEDAHGEEGGIIVQAKPPGKRNSTIYLLSGGEKALTAIALVFSLFKLNPAPFCVLDEVDAPLDDANTIRFNQLVKAMAKDIEFIFISHNKIAIEMAEHLIGVAMREPGVSRLVTVDIQQALAMAEKGVMA